jgi:hypothetical protein
MRKDIKHFADAMVTKGLDPSEVVERGLGGANGLLDLVQRVTAGRPNA